MTAMDVSAQQSESQPQELFRVRVQPCGVHLDGDVCDCPMAEAAWLLEETLAVNGGWPR